MIKKIKPRIILIGGGGHCAACIDVIEAEDKYEIEGITDNRTNIKSVSGYAVLGDDNILSTMPSHIDNALITVGQLNSPLSRIKLFELVSRLGFKQPVIISPRAYVSQHARLGKGTIIMHDALINTRAVIGNNSIINSKALIEHDAIVEDHCHISTGAIINGGAVIKRGTFVGSHATVIENATSNEAGFIKAGSLFKGE